MERLLYSKEEIIRYLKRELKVQQDDFKNQLDCLIKEKEDLQLDLHRRAIEDKQNGLDLPQPLARKADPDRLPREPDRRQPDAQAKADPLDQYRDLRRSVLELKAELTKAENENCSLHALHKKDTEKLKALDDQVSRLNEEVSATKQDLMQIFNLIFERNDRQLLEKVERIINYHRSFY